MFTSENQHPVVLKEAIVEKWRHCRFDCAVETTKLVGLGMLLEDLERSLSPQRCTSENLSRSSSCAASRYALILAGLFDVTNRYIIYVHIVF